MSNVQIDENIHIAVNEQRNNIYVINRCLSKLISNDKKLLSLYEEILQSIHIQPYDPSNKYYENDIVWFVSGTNLYILRCISTNNTYPHFNELTQSFEETGWQNQMEYIHLLKVGADNIIKTQINNKFFQHNLNKTYHRYGKISASTSSPDYVQNKILNRDLGMQTNIGKIAYPRELMQFPYQTVSLNPDESIIQGYYRKYDCGLLEYDLVFKFGMTNNTQDTIYGNKNVLSCNNVTLNVVDNVLKSGSFDSQQRNSQYFFGSCYDIFRINNPTDSSSIIGNTIQINRNDFINTYFSSIHFPQLFFNTNYNVFISDMTSQTSDGESLNYSPNTMTVCDKTQDSFKIIYVTYPLATKTEYNTKGRNATFGGLAINSFHCQIVGRWR